MNKLSEQASALQCTKFDEENFLLTSKSTSAAVFETLSHNRLKNRGRSLLAPQNSLLEGNDMKEQPDQKPAHQRTKCDEVKFFAYLKENACHSLLDFLHTIDRRAWVEMSSYIIRYSQRSEEDDIFLARKQRGIEKEKALTATIRDLNKSKANYTALASIEIPGFGTLGRPGSLLWPEGTTFFGDLLEAETSKLAAMLASHKEIYNEKRFGVSANHTWLIMLEEFTVAWTKWELGQARKLRAEEIADLITAGRHTLGWGPDRTEVDPELIRKAIRKYRGNEANAKFLSHQIIPYVQQRCEVVANWPYLPGIEM